MTTTNTTENTTNEINTMNKVTYQAPDVTVSERVKFTDLVSGLKRRGEGKQKVMLKLNDMGFDMAAIFKLENDPDAWELTLNSEDNTINISVA